MTNVRTSWLAAVFASFLVVGCGGPTNSDAGDATDARGDTVGGGDVQLPPDNVTVDVPVTDVPVTDVPVADVPVTDVPVTDVPRMDVPVTDVPVTDVPVTDAPVTDVPVTDVPVVDVPMTDVPVTLETYVAQLSGAEEVPVVSTASSGTVNFTYNPTTRALTWMITHTVTTPTGAHIHTAGAGENGGVTVTLTMATGSSGMATLTVAQETDLRLGHFYVNVHTAVNPGGEVRGQVLRPGESLYVATLTGSQEVPANRSAATGVASVIVNAARTSWHFRANTSLTPTAAHIHSAIAGVNGGVLYSLGTAGMLMEGNQAITAADFTALDNTALYVNAHTAAFPGGEIRGQLLRAGSELFVANLTGAQENPPVTTSLTGNSSVALDYRSSNVRYALVTTATATAVHIHRAIGGINGAVVLPYAGTTSPLFGMGVLPAGEVDALRIAQLYVNVHTAANPGGELRGQLIRPGEQLFVAIMSGANEVPPVTTTAGGATQMVLNAAGTSLAYQSVITMLAAATASHIHNAPAGTNGAVVYALTLVGVAPTGTQAITATEEMNLAMSRYYVNIHTTTNPGGELRGQLVQR